MKIIRGILICLFFLPICYCGKKSSETPLPPPDNFNVAALSVNGKTPPLAIVYDVVNFYDVNKTPLIKLKFLVAIDRNSVPGSISFKEKSGNTVSYNAFYENADSTIIIQPAQPLKNLVNYAVTVNPQLKSTGSGHLITTTVVNFLTSIDSSRKFPAISDDSLLTLVQKQTFKYFWDFGHPVSALARERNSSGDVVTTGGSGFGIMAILAAINRDFITRAEGLQRLQTITSFLTNTAQKYHGAFPHWLNGTTGATIPFSPNDNGADLVETSYLMQGLLCARQFFNGASADETNLRNSINALWNNVEWDWFRQNNQDVLYWHWSPDKDWIMNFPIRGWNECLITYLLAASSTTHSIPKSVYDNGWAQNGLMRNNSAYYGYVLPLGPPFGGPLFFSHYSFLGTNPDGLSDPYANYQTQTTNHTLINYNYCKINPKNFFGYSDSCWGLTASDNQNGYDAHSPTNDLGVITPTAALSSFPYTPVESMQALKFFYYVLGDKIWKDYGFVDAFNLTDVWFADSFLAIDQGPIIVMIENYRSGLLWTLFTGCPEIKTGLTNLGFSAPYL